MRFYLTIRGEWAEEFSFWVPKGGLLYVWLDDLPLAVEEVELHRGEFLVGVETDFDPGGSQ